MALELCKDCGRMHYRTDPCRAPKTNRVSSSVVEQTNVRAEDAGSIPASPPPKKRGRPRLANPKSPRAEYQRNLMAKRYAEKKPRQQ